jgi:hypothetical protein
MIGKYFIGVHDEAMRSGIIEARVSDHHYLVRFDEFVGFTDGSKWPESLAVVPVCDMVGYKDPPPWLLFDTRIVPGARGICQVWGWGTMRCLRNTKGRGG